MKKLLSVLLVLCFSLALLPATALAADKTLTLTENWQLTSDLDLNVGSGDVLIIDGANKYYIYEMGGKLTNTTSGAAVYLKDTYIYAQGDNPSSGSLAALSKAARGIVAVAAPAKDATALTLPTVEGYTVTIKSSSNTGVISTSGTIVPTSEATQVTLVLTLTDVKGNQSYTGGIQITVPAKTQVNQGSDPSGNPSGNPSGDSSTQTAAPAAGGAVLVNYTQSGGTVTLSLPDSKVTEIIGKSKNVTTIDISKVSNATVAVLPKTALDTIANVGLNVEIKLPQGTVTLDTAAVQSVVASAQGANVSVAAGVAAATSLNSAQQATIGSSDKVFDISILSGTQNITSFKGGIDVTVPYTGQLPVGAWYLSSAGVREKLTSLYDTASKTISFELPGHLSLYVVGHDEIKDTGAWENPFTDVSESDWFYGHVEYVHKNALFAGVTTDKFSPNTAITRGMLVTVLYHLHGATPSIAYENPFSDVPEGKYYTDAVLWAAANGIVSGTGHNKFAPDASTSRQDLAVIIKRYADFAGKQVPVTQQYTTFADEAKIRDYAEQAIEALYSAGIISGKPGNLYDPQGSTTRAETAVVLHKFAVAAEK